jgi:hypothetical protein
MDKKCSDRPWQRKALDLAVIARPFVAISIAGFASHTLAEPIKLTCEAWHPRLGQNPDATFVIDVAAKKCNGQPCSISDSEIKWQEQNGKYEFTINRASRDGTYLNLGDLLLSYKNCAPAV